MLGFLEELQQQQSRDDWKCVIKPNESAGTDSVFLCTSTEEALRAFRLIHNQVPRGLLGCCSGCRYDKNDE